MSDRTTVIVPRRRRDVQAPPAPLDPFVTQLVRWIAGHQDGIALTALAKRAAASLDWQPPFADAVVTATRSRRLLTVMQTTARGGYRIGLSTRGREWLDHHPE